MMKPRPKHVHTAIAGASLPRHALRLVLQCGQPLEQRNLTAVHLRLPRPLLLLLLLRSSVRGNAVVQLQLLDDRDHIQEPARRRVREEHVRVVRDALAEPIQRRRVVLKAGGVPVELLPAQHVAGVQAVPGAAEDAPPLHFHATIL